MSSEIAGMFLRQSKLFLEILREFNELSDTSISPDERKFIRSKINDKINNYLKRYEK